MIVTITEEFIVKNKEWDNRMWACCLSRKAAEREVKAIKRQEGYEPIIVHKQYDKPEQIYFAFIPWVQLKLGYF